MICFVTGASGFLGKRILRLLIADTRIEKIHLVSRQKKTHPHPKIKLHSFDLTEPWPESEFFKEVDVVLNLAGLYDFTKEFSENYKQNVLTVLNLIDRIAKLKRAPQIFHASTYAVGVGSQGPLNESPLKELPSQSNPYAYTKAIGEQVLSESGFPVRIFRLGILVGDSVTGEFEKIDGPYTLLHFFSSLKRWTQSAPVLRHVGKIPIPGDPNSVLPLVPVDAAASIFHQAVFLEPIAQKESQTRFYGLFNTESLSAKSLVDTLCKELLPSFESVFINPESPRSKKLLSGLVRYQALLTGIPSYNFDFSLHPIELKNPEFQAVFGTQAIPHFDRFRSSFFAGWENHYAQD